MSRIKITQNDYINKLQNKGLETYPLEKYINTRTKILHRCKCGNKWDINPNQALKGNTCGCSLSTSKEEFEQRKLELNNKIILQEPYINLTTKILCKCICGNVWKVTPHEILHGNACGCIKRENNKISKIELYRKRKTILYYIKIDNLWKIGVCLYKSSVKQSIKNRFSTAYNRGCTIDILKSKVYEKGEIAYLLEQTILEQFSEYRYKANDMNWFGGHTELFSEDISKIKG